MKKGSRAFCAVETMINYKLFFIICLDHVLYYLKMPCTTSNCNKFLGFLPHLSLPFKDILYLSYWLNSTGSGMEFLKFI